jgi:hypothetical protein
MTGIRAEAFARARERIHPSGFEVKYALLPIPASLLVSSRCIDLRFHAIAHPFRGFDQLLGAQPTIRHLL